MTSMKRSLYLYIYILAVTLLTSCGTHKGLTEQIMIGGLSGTEYLEQVIRLAPSWECVTGKAALTLDLGGKGKGSINANIKIKRDEAIRLTVAPVLGIEVARLEIRPDGLLILDRMDKRYILIDFAELSRLANTELDFNVLQCLFLGELFVPGKPHLDAADAASFRVELGDEWATLGIKGTSRLKYSFRTSLTQPQLLRSDISLHHTPYGISWDYSDFRPLDGRPFPHHSLLTVQGISNPVSLDMRLSKLGVKGGWDARTEVPSKYREVTLDEILKLITKK